MENERPSLFGFLGGLLPSAFLCLVLFLFPPARLVGPQGDVGPQGRQGVTGARGEVGPRGPQGYPGERGLPGVRGEVGDVGPRGEIGLQGPPGRDGKDGEKGDSAFDRIPPHMLNSTYSIFVQTAKGRSAGAGYAVSKRTIHTCAHLFDENPVSISVEKRADEHKGSILIDAKVVYVDFNADIAIIEVDQDLPAFAEEDFTSQYRQGDAVIVVGNPSSVGVVATVGYLGQHIQGIEGFWPEVVLSSNAVYGGNSGGPVFDAKTGKVIGILVGGTRAPNVALIVPLSKYEKVFRSK